MPEASPPVHAPVDVTEIPFFQGPATSTTFVAVFEKFAPITPEPTAPVFEVVTDGVVPVLEKFALPAAFTLQFEPVIEVKPVPLPSTRSAVPPIVTGVPTAASIVTPPPA